MKYQKIIDKMTLEEKASLTSGGNFWNTKAIERLGIPSMMLTDGPHGLRKQGGKADNLGLNQSIPATCYPTASGLANTWNEELVEEMGKALGLEVASEGVSVLLGPGVNIKRSPLCGRNFEYFSEDPLLTGKMAAALIRGIQSNGVSACVKHFAVNSQETMRMVNDSVIDERTLREIYLPAFEIAVKEGKVKTLMTSYNKVNGTYANENLHLLRDILYGEWGFEGMVVTDWGGNNDRAEGLIAGNALEMPSTNGQTDRYVVEAVKSGKLDESILNEQIDRLLTLLFDVRPHIQGKTYDKIAHHKIAEKVALETAVLLKNRDKILPLKSGQKVAVIGDFVKNPRYQGAGSSKIEPTKLENALEALKKAGVNVLGFEEGFLRGGKKDSILQTKACVLAKHADIVLLYLGLDEGGEAEGVDRQNMKLPSNQIQLLKALQKANQNIVVVLSCGSPVEMDWDKYAKAVLHGYLGGQAGASAQASLLTGKTNPSGKLSETIPYVLEDVPSDSYYPGRERTAEYREGLYVGYRYYDTAKVPVKYPFGFGLSYTSFTYSNLKIDGNRVSVQIKNTGDVEGAEIVQLYVSANTGGMFRPEQELKGFQKVWLKPGEIREIQIQLNDRSFAVWSISKNDWVAEPGEYEIRVGASSQDIRLRGVVKKTGEPVENPYPREIFAPYYVAAVKSVPDEVFERLIERQIPESKWKKGESFDLNNTISQGKYLQGGFGKILYQCINMVYNILIGLERKEDANNLMFIMHLPYRGVARMSGVLSENQVLALLKVINREKGGWCEFAKSLLRREQVFTKREK